MEKHFPNGFISWKETYHETVLFIAENIREFPGETSVINKSYRHDGHTGLYDVAEGWADEFEEKYKGAKWGEDEALGNWNEVVWEFCEQKNKL